jgi:hypothetical protein
LEFAAPAILRGSRRFPLNCAAPPKAHLTIGTEARLLVNESRNAVAAV